MKRLWIAIFLISLSLSGIALADTDPKVDAVASRLSCFCGTCPHLVVTGCGCSNADQIKADIRTMLAKGMGEQEIIDSFVAKYGETVLAAPPKHGFSLAAWGIPFGAFLFGAVILFKFLRRQQQPPDDQPKPPASPSSPESVDDEMYREELQRELESSR